MNSYTKYPSEHFKNFGSDTNIDVVALKMPDCLATYIRENLATDDHETELTAFYNNRPNDSTYDYYHRYEELIYYIIDIGEKQIYNILSDDTDEYITAFADMFGIFFINFEEFNKFKLMVMQAAQEFITQMAAINILNVYFEIAEVNYNFVILYTPRRKPWQFSN